jgi:hypothetical protein
MKSVCSHLGQAIKTLPYQERMDVRNLLTTISELMVGHINVFEYYRNFIGHEFSEDKDNFLLEEIMPEQLLNISNNTEKFQAALLDYAMQNNYVLKMDPTAAEYIPVSMTHN